MKDLAHVLCAAALLLCIAEVQGHCYESSIVPSSARPGEDITVSVRIYKGGLCVCIKAMSYTTVNISAPPALEPLTPTSQTGTSDSFTLDYTLRVRDDAEPGQYAIPILGRGKETSGLFVYSTSFDDSVALRVLPPTDASFSTRPAPIYQNDPAERIALFVALTNKGIHDATDAKICVLDMGGLDFAATCLDVGWIGKGTTQDVELPLSGTAGVSAGKHTVKLSIQHDYGTARRVDDLEAALNVLSGEPVQKARDAISDAQRQLDLALAEGLRSTGAQSRLAEANGKLDGAKLLFSNRKFSETPPMCDQAIRLIKDAYKALPRIANQTCSATWCSALIRWDTDEFTNATIVYGSRSGTYNETWFEPTKAVQHAANLTGLSPSKLYYYVIKATDPRGNSASTYQATFTTQYRPVKEAFAPFLSSAIVLSLALRKRMLGHWQECGDK